MNAEHEVAERRLTVVIEEACGGGPPADLAARIAVSLGPVPAPRHRGRAALPAALLMVAAVAVVLAIARWHAPPGAAASPQDPSAREHEVRKVTITTAMVRAACALVDAPPPGEVVARLLVLANRAPFGVVVAPGVHGESRTDVQGLTWHEAVRQIAADVGAGVADHGTMVVVGPGEVIPLERTRCVARGVPFVDVRDLPRMLERACGLDLVVGDDCTGHVALDVANVPGRALLEVVADRLALQVVGCGSVLALRRAAPAKAPARLVLNLAHRPVAEAIDRWVAVAGGNVVVGPDVAGVVSVRASSPDPASLWTALTAAVGAEIVADDRGILRVVPRLAAPGTVSSIAARVTVEAAARTAGVAELLAPGTADGRLHAHVAVSDVCPIDLLRAVAVATGRRWSRRDRAYAVE